MQVVWHGHPGRCRCKTGCALFPSFSAGLQGCFPCRPGIGLWSFWSLLWCLVSTLVYLWSLVAALKVCLPATVCPFPTAQRAPSIHQSINLPRAHAVAVSSVAFSCTASPLHPPPSLVCFLFPFPAPGRIPARSSSLGTPKQVADAAPTVVAAAAAAAAAPRAAHLRVCPPTTHPSPPQVSPVQSWSV